MVVESARSADVERSDVGGEADKGPGCLHKLPRGHRVDASAHVVLRACTQGLCTDVHLVGVVLLAVSRGQRCWWWQPQAAAGKVTGLFASRLEQAVLEYRDLVQSWNRKLAWVLLNVSSIAPGMASAVPCGGGLP